MITPRALEVLTRAGHSGRQFNWGMGRVLGAWALPPPGATFTRYTVPSLQMRRMLEEATTSNEPFELEYSVLEGAYGDEAWRVASAGVRRVRVRSDGRGSLACAVVSEGLFGQACASGELALQPLALWERALGAWNPHPIVEGMAEEMHCFGP